MLERRLGLPGSGLTPLSISQLASPDTSIHIARAISGDMNMYEEDGIQASLDQLRSAVVELSSALNEALRDERHSASACLKRVQVMLQVTDESASRLAESASR